MMIADVGLRLKSLWRSLVGCLIWDWSHLGTQGFANVLQVVTLFLAIVSFYRYFAPEQELKETQKELKQVLADKKEASLALVITRNERNTVVERKNAELAALSSQISRLEEDRTAAEARATDAGTKANQAERRLQDASQTKAALEAEIERLQREQISANDQLLSARGEAVLFRHKARSILFSSLPQYISVFCRPAESDTQGFGKCASRLLKTGDYSEYFSEREMRLALDQLEPVAQDIEAKWTNHIAQTMRDASALKAKCEGAPVKDKDACVVTAGFDAVHLQQRALNYYAAQAFVAERLKPWAQGILIRPACPEFDERKSLPKNWPKDCL